MISKHREGRFTVSIRKDPNTNKVDVAVLQHPTQKRRPDFYGRCKGILLFNKEDLSDLKKAIDGACTKMEKGL